MRRTFLICLLVTMLTSLLFEQEQSSVEAATNAAQDSLTMAQEDDASPIAVPEPSEKAMGYFRGRINSQVLRKT